MPSLIVIALIVWFLLSKSKPSSRSSSNKTQTVKAPKAAEPQNVPEAEIPVVASSVIDSEPDNEPVQPLTPTVHVTPHDHSDMFAGSLYHDLTEGTDMDMPSDHSAELFSFQEEEAVSISPSGSPLHFSDNDIVNAMILQEVLKRPCHRNAYSNAG